MKTLLSKYKHVWTLLYFPVYLAVFFWLENRSVSKYHVVQSTLDSHIPFLEIFIIPYFLWFGFVALGVVYFFFKDVKDYYRLIAFLYSGMTIFLIWSYVYPNRLFLRPMAFTRDISTFPFTMTLLSAVTLTTLPITPQPYSPS